MGDESQQSVVSHVWHVRRCTQCAPIFTQASQTRCVACFTVLIAPMWGHVAAPVMERLAASDDLDEILGLIIDSMRDCLGAERASVFEYDRDRNELFAHRGHGVDDLGIV